MMVVLPSLIRFIFESRYFQPRITAIDDVPEDEGGRVYVEFQRLFFDHADQNNQFYTIFRLDEVEDSTLWVSTVTGTAGGDESYVFEVSTVVDSSEENNGTTQFKVIAFMNAGTFESDVSIGYSLDNLAPEAPTGLEAWWWMKVSIFHGTYLALMIFSILIWIDHYLKILQFMRHSH
ncbi:hypothetical protein Ct9H90mP29_07540 [bacterium]|nr:MAG: hypothetical protein Ct9H90mP29_07540 [bacterium]